MTAVVCVDDQGGILFNRRRQSQDRCLQEKLLSLAGDRPLLVSPYTARQFPPEAQGGLQICEDCYEQADPQALCFAEDSRPDLTLPEPSRVILFRWNRVYPADRYFDLAALSAWHLETVEDFPGHSHEKITMEVYTR